MTLKDELWDSTASPKHYDAYAVKDKAIAIEVVRATMPTRCPGYQYFLDISAGRVHQTSFALIFTFMIIVARGERLKEIIDAIKLRKCTMIQEFRPDDFDEPASDRPVIRSLEIIVKSIPDMIAEGEKNFDLP